MSDLISRQVAIEALQDCPYCGKKPIIEHWSSGGYMYMVKCNNPDCLHLEMYPTGRKLDEVKAEWNRRATSIKENR